MKTKMLNKKAGFSLVELLVVIAVIGIIAAIAVPQISRINESASEATAKRNAQNIVSVASSALAAGHDFVGADIKTSVEGVVAGTTIADAASPFDGTFFGVPNLQAVDIASAGSYVDITNSMLVYDPAGDAEAHE